MTDVQLRRASDWPEVKMDVGSTNEFDPNGLNQHTPGAKLDAGKVRPSLIFNHMPLALLEVARVGTYGAIKYTEGGWQYVENGIQRYTDAMDRHRLAERGHTLSPDEATEISHAAHLAWNALARLELMLREVKQKCTNPATFLGIRPKEDMTE